LAVPENDRIDNIPAIDAPPAFVGPGTPFGRAADKGLKIHHSAAFQAIHVHSSIFSNDSYILQKFHNAILRSSDYIQFNAGLNRVKIIRESLRQPDDS
jgi:hypothetical protein